MTAHTAATARQCRCGRPARTHCTQCTACQPGVYRARHRAGHPTPYPRRVDLDEVAHLLASGAQLPEIARRLGVTADGIQGAARRARAAEDAAITAGKQEEYSVRLSRLTRLLDAERAERAAYAASLQVARRAGGWWR